MPLIQQIEIMRIWRIIAITLLCCLLDGIARSFLPSWGADSRAWLYYTLLILTVGDIFYYLIFVVVFETINSQFNQHHSIKLSILIGSGLAVCCFLLFGSLRFWQPEQKIIMGFAYGLIGVLYGYLHARWAVGSSNYN